MNNFDADGRRIVAIVVVLEDEVWVVKILSYCDSYYLMGKDCVIGSESRQEKIDTC